MKDFDSARSAFEMIYERNHWDFGSGPGSLPSSTIEYRAFVERFIHENNIKTVTDLGCGDWQFSRYMNWSGIQYTGIDAVPSLVDKNRAHYGSTNITFEVSAGPDSLPGGDLLLSKEVLQHLPNEMIASYLSVIANRYKFALITNSVAPSGNPNRDIQIGGFRSLRLEAAPFHARGANIFTYCPRKGDAQMWANNVFLILGSN